MRNIVWLTGDQMDQLCPFGAKSLGRLRVDHRPCRFALGSLPAAAWMIADRDCDDDWFREALRDKGIRPCIPGRKSRGWAARYDKRRYKRWNRIEIMFGRQKELRPRRQTLRQVCAKTFLSAAALAATVMLWL